MCFAVLPWRLLRRDLPTLQARRQLRDQRAEEGATRGHGGEATGEAEGQGGPGISGENFVDFLGEFRGRLDTSLWVWEIWFHRTDDFFSDLSGLFG